MSVQHTIDSEFLILNADGLIVNVTVGVPPNIPEGWEALCREGLEGPWIGWTRIDGVFIDPNPDVEEPI